jgi:hypothetical protein
LGHWTIKRLQLRVLPGAHSHDFGADARSMVVRSGCYWARRGRALNALSYASRGATCGSSFGPNVAENR